MRTVLGRWVAGSIDRGKTIRAQPGTPGRFDLTHMRTSSSSRIRNGPTEQAKWTDSPPGAVDENSLGAGPFAGVVGGAGMGQNLDAGTRVEELPDRDRDHRSFKTAGGRSSATRREHAAKAQKTRASRGIDSAAIGPRSDMGILAKASADRSAAAPNTRRGKKSTCADRGGIVLNRASISISDTGPGQMWRDATPGRPVEPVDRVD